MTILVNTDNHIHGSAALAQHVEGIVEDELGHLTDQITRVEVHVGDVNGHKGGGNDIHCSMEARLEGHQPIGVANEAGSVDEAVEGAAGKLERSLEHTLGRLRAR